MKLMAGVRLSCPTLILSLLVLASLTAPAQSSASPQTVGNVDAALGELQSQVHELKQMVLQLQEQTAESRAEISRLRLELQAQRSPGGESTATGDEMSAAHNSSSLAERLGQVEEDQQLLSAKVDQQEQTKVESASKYRVRFSGLLLFNLFANRGQVDNQDVPAVATGPGPGDSSGSVGATLRQSVLGFEVFGPEVAGARTSGNVNFDFGGGFPSLSNGVNSPLMRLRTATLRLDWSDTSVVAGQDQLFFAPLTPTSYASVIEPALSYSGALWSWTPQIRVEHRFAFSEDSNFMLQGGVLDPLTGEPPYYYEWYRSPGAGELSRQPAFAARASYSHRLFGQTFTIGSGGYYSRQDWLYDRKVNGWAGTLDLNMPLGRRFTLSTEGYRGAAIGGLGAGIGRSVFYNGSLSNASTLVRPLNAVGGWAQLKYRPLPKLEFNGAFGEDNSFAADVRAFASYAESYGDPTLTRNHTAFGNVIYHPRSDLLFSFEFRRLRTFTIDNESYEANQVNMSMGVLF